MLISMLLLATFTYNIGAPALFFAMSKFMAFEAAHWKRDVRSHWYCKVTIFQACRRLWTMTSQGNCICRNLIYVHMNAQVVDNIIEFLHNLFLRTVQEVAMLNDTLRSVETLLKPNSYMDIQNDQTFSSFISPFLFRSSTMR